MPDLVRYESCRDYLGSQEIGVFLGNARFSRKYESCRECLGTQEIGVSKGNAKLVGNMVL